MKRIAWFTAISGALLLVAVGLDACGGGGDSANLRAQVATLQTQVAKPTPKVWGVVVGISWSCDMPGPVPRIDQYCEDWFNPQWCGFMVPVPDGCVAIYGPLTAAMRIETLDGATYTTTAENPVTDIHVGDPWPPSK